MMYCKKIITFLILLLGVYFLSGCTSFLSSRTVTLPYDPIPFYGFAPNGRSEQSYDMECGGAGMRGLSDHEFIRRLQRPF